MCCVPHCHAVIHTKTNITAYLTDIKHANTDANINRPDAFVLTLHLPVIQLFSGDGGDDDKYKSMVAFEPVENGKTYDLYVCVAHTHMTCV